MPLAVSVNDVVYYETEDGGNRLRYVGIVDRTTTPDLNGQERLYVRLWYHGVKGFLMPVPVLVCKLERLCSLADLEELCRDAV